MSSIDNTLKERGSRYGEFVDHADITQNLKAAMALGRNWDSLDNDMREALEMMAHKVGRILNGDPNYIDSWTDIIGYARLVEKRLIDTEPKMRESAIGRDNVVPLGTKSDRNIDPMKKVQTAVEEQSSVSRDPTVLYKAAIEEYAVREAFLGKAAEDKRACDCLACQLEALFGKARKAA